jgi:hypothetical protein
MRTATKSLRLAFDTAFVDTRRPGNHRDAEPAPAHSSIVTSPFRILRNHPRPIETPAEGSRGLKAQAHMALAVRMPRNFLLAAEMEVAVLRIADGPAAIAGQEREHRLPLCWRRCRVIVSERLPRALHAHTPTIHETAPHEIGSFINPLPNPALTSNTGATGAQHPQPPTATSRLNAAPRALPRLQNP